MNKFAALLSLTDVFVALAEKVHGPYKRKSDGREIVIIIDDDGNRRTVSYPKYLIEKHLGHSIGDNTVDHLNFDKNDNRIENLRVVPRDQHSSDDTKRVKLIKLNCDWCHKEFERSPRLLRDKNKKGASGVFCSRNCSAKYNRAVQLGKVDKLPVQPYYESEYYRKKNVQASLQRLIEKYS